MVREPEAQEERIARAFAPGHVTGIFAPSLGAADPRERGSVGAGIVLEAGATATATWSPSGRGRLEIHADLRTPLPISREVANRLFHPRVGWLRIELHHELPVSQGFGMSAAGALATGLAVAAVLGVPEGKAIEVAHLADLFGGGGLGGVSAILGGGLEIRSKAGIPPYGRIRHRPFGPPVVICVLGAPLPSPKLLRDPTFLERVTGAASAGLRQLSIHADAPTFLEASQRFTDELKLAPPSLQRLLPELRSTGARVAQAMLGRSLFAVPTSGSGRRRLLKELERRGISAVELNSSRRGARVLGPR